MVRRMHRRRKTADLKSAEALAQVARAAGFAMATADDQPDDVAELHTEAEFVHAVRPLALLPVPVHAAYAAVRMPDIVAALTWFRSHLPALRRGHPA